MNQKPTLKKLPGVKISKEDFKSLKKAFDKQIFETYQESPFFWDNFDSYLNDEGVITQKVVKADCVNWLNHIEIKMKNMKADLGLPGWHIAY